MLCLQKQEAFVSLKINAVKVKHGNATVIERFHLSVFLDTALLNYAWELELQKLSHKL